MIATSHFHSGRINIVGAALLTIVTVLPGAACASAGWHRGARSQSTTSGARTDVIPGSWERVAHLPAATRVAVTLKTGERIDGRFRALQPDALVLTDPAGTERSVTTS